MSDGIPVHDIDVKSLCASLHHFLALLEEKSEIG